MVFPSQPEEMQNLHDPDFFNIPFPPISNIERIVHFNFEVLDFVA